MNREESPHTRHAARPRARQSSSTSALVAATTMRAASRRGRATSSTLRARAGVVGDADPQTRVRGRLGRWAVGRRARGRRGRRARGDADDERRGRVVVVDGGDAREGVFARGRRGGERVSHLGGVDVGTRARARCCDVGARARGERDGDRGDDERVRGGAVVV